MRLRKLTFCAVLTAAALVTFVLESQIPPLTAVPGVKLGLSNIFTLFALEALGAGWALALLLIRVLLGSIVTGQMTALLYSLCGGFAAFAGMLILKRPLCGEKLWVRSVFCAMLHNAGQLAAASAVMATNAIWYYLPVLLLAAILTGGFTGLCAQLCLKRLVQSRLLPKWKENEGVTKK